MATFRFWVMPVAAVQTELSAAYFGELFEGIHVLSQPVDA
jgi:hypothetical protein